MEINVDLIEQFLLKRLNEEKEKNLNTYECINSKESVGMPYMDHVIDAVPTLMKDLRYAFEHTEVFFAPKQRSINDYDNVEEALNNAFRYYGPVDIANITLIINDKIEHYIVDTLMTDQLAYDLNYEISNHEFLWWYNVSSYHLMYFENTQTLSILIHS